MQNTYIRSKLNIYRRKIVFFGCVFLFSSLTSQIDHRYNLPEYDKQKIHFGYHLGLNYSTFKLVQSDNFVQKDTVKNLYAVGKTGFQVGFIFNLRLSEYLDFRALPMVSFYEREIKFVFKSPAKPISVDFQASVIELPLLIKYKSHRRLNSRLYMIGGLKPSFEVGAKKRQNRSNQLGTSVVNLALDYGIGFDSYQALFKFAPELRFSLGLTDMLKRQDNLLTESLKTVKPFNVSLSILFE